MFVIMRNGKYFMEIRGVFVRFSPHLNHAKKFQTEQEAKDFLKEYNFQSEVKALT